jgi:NADH-quinone oxidoreductase subunit G
MIELTINGKKIKADPGSTILQAAQKNNIFIPNMCYDKRLRPYGGCRLCVVEVEGQPRLFAACSTPVTEGMVVHTETPKLAKARKTVLELLLLHHPLDCPICDKAGECDLQDLAFKYGPAESRFYAERKHDPERLDAPIVERNPNRCILCGKCVRVCAEHQGVGALAFIGRGFKTKVSPAFEETLNCEFCGQCVDACPVGALGTRHYRHRSRVWFMEEFSAICPYCGCGCTTNLSLREGKIIRARGKEGVGINDGNLCSKGRFGFDYIYSENRLKTPLIRKNGNLTPVSWKEAIEYIANRLKDIKEKHGASSIGAIGSQRCTLEDNFVFQKFVREVLDTDNIDSAARFGYAKAVKAMKLAFGLEYNPIKWDAPLNADYILVVESDITSTLPVWGLNFIQAKNRGAKLIVADIKETKLARHSTDWLRIRPGSGTALLNGVARIIIDEGLYDKDKVSKIPNFDSFVDGLKDFSVSNVSELTGIDDNDIVRLAKDYAGSKNRLIALTSNSSENTKSINTILSATNLLLLMGDGPENIQIPAEFSNTLGMWTVGVRPLSGGLDAYKMLYEKGNIKALYIAGENPLVSFQDVSKVEEVLKDLDFIVVQDIFLTDTAKLAHVVLPACSWSEKEGMFMSATGDIQKTSKLLKETGQSMPDWKIFCDIAKAMDKDLGINDLMSIRAAIADKVVKEEIKEITPTFNPTKLDLLESTNDEFPMFLITANILQHSGALSALSKNLDSVVSDAYLQVNTKDAKRLNIYNESFVRVRSKRGEVYLKAMLSDEVPEGIVFAPIHFSHAKINTLTYPSINGGLPLVAVKIEGV